MLSRLKDDTGSVGLFGVWEPSDCFLGVWEPTDCCAGVWEPADCFGMRVLLWPSYSCKRLDEWKELIPAVGVGGGSGPGAGVWADDVISVSETHKQIM